MIGSNESYYEQIDQMQVLEERLEVTHQLINKIKNSNN